MRHLGALIVMGAAVAVGAGCGAADDRGTAEPQRSAVAVAALTDPAPTQRPKAFVVNCSSRSMADFPDAFENPDNIVSRPLVVGGAVHIPAATIREFGGDKVPVLVPPGHRVTLQLTRAGHRVASLAYGPEPGVIEHADGRRAVTFKPCRRERHSGSTAGGREHTFWMGFVLARKKACVPLYAWIDDEPEPRRLMLGLGRRDCE